MTEIEIRAEKRKWMTEARLRHDKKVEDVATDLNVAPSTIYRIESGETKKVPAEIYIYYNRLDGDMI